MNFEFDTALGDSLQKHTKEIYKIAFFCEYQYLGFLKADFYRGFRIQFCLKFGRSFGAKTTQFDVIVIRNISFQALTKNF